MINTNFYNRINLTLALCFGLLLALAAAPIAYGETGWSPVQQLPTGKGNPQEPSVYADGDFVHLVYLDTQIYYLRSTDRGKTWEPRVLLSGKKLFNSAPSILGHNGVMYVVFPTLSLVKNQKSLNLTLTTSRDQGKTWNQPKVILNSNQQSLAPKLLPLDQAIGIVWQDFEQYTVSSKQPLDFELIKDLLENPMVGLIKQKQNEISRYQISFIRSYDEGGTFSLPIRIRETFDKLPFCTAFSDGQGKVEVIWDEGSRIRTAISKDNGVTWNQSLQNPERLSNIAKVDITYNGGNSHYVWIRELYEPQFIYYRMGRTGNPVKIAGPETMRSQPRIAYGGGEVHVVWASTSVDYSKNALKYSRSDDQPPYTEITSPLDLDVKENEIEFTWVGHEDISEPLDYEYKMAGNPWRQHGGSTSLTIKAPRDGQYDFSVRVTDAADNVETSPPVITFNTYKVPPQTVMTKEVAEIIPSRSLEVSWQGEDNNPETDNLDFSYRLDDGEWSEFKMTTQTKLTKLTEGEHTFEVRARDPQGNVDASPAQQGFTVELGIDVFFVTEVGELFNVPEVTFAWDAQDVARDSTSYTFAYRLDRKKWTDWAYQKDFTFSNLLPGPHILEVKARDDGGNLSVNILTHEFTIDLDPPTLAVTKVARDGSTGNLPTLNLTASDDYSQASEIEFSYQIDEEGWSPFNLETVIVIPQELKIWSPGYRVAFRGRDTAGNVTAEPPVVSYMFIDRHSLVTLILLGGVALVIVGVVLLILFKTIMSKVKKPIKTASQEDEFDSSKSSSSQPEGEPEAETKVVDEWGDDPEPASPPDEKLDDDMFGDSENKPDEDSPGRKPQSPDDDDLFG